MPEHYCHNCHHWGRLADGVHCGFCLDFWNEHHRMPTKADPVPATDSLSRIYRQMGWS